VYADSTRINRWRRPVVWSRLSDDAGWNILRSYLFAD
jgi:hypothetical protein